MTTKTIKDSEVDEPKGRLGRNALILTICFVVVVWLLNWFLVWRFLGKSDERGDFGDMFGAVNALFSGLAFAVLIYTMLLQREELKLQREELKLQREVLELQAAELKRQADELVKTVELQKTGLELQKKQFEHLQEAEEQNRENSLKPSFVQMGRISQASTANSKFLLSLVLRNEGAAVTTLRITGEFLDGDPVEIDQMGAKHLLQLDWLFDGINNVPEEIPFEISYLDKQGRKNKKRFTIKNDKTTESPNERFYLEL